MLRSSTIRWRWLHKTLIFSLVLDISFRFLIFFAAAADVAAFERSLLLQFKQSVSDPGGLLSGWTPTDSLSVACGVGLTLSTSEMPEKETPERMTPPNPPPPPPFKLILGSSSMPRRQLLAEMGYQFTLMSADIDEKGIRREKPEELVMALAEAKADAIISKLQITDYKDDIEPTLLITADQRKSSKETIQDWL